MNDVVTTVDAYLAMWNESDPSRRARLIERAWAADGRYVDPMLEAEGHQAINEMVAGLDIGTLARDGRLRCIIGFFGEVPGATAA
jgi:hypothetical protein